MKYNVHVCNSLPWFDGSESVDQIVYPRLSLTIFGICNDGVDDSVE